ncbi:uncharacterized protein LOC142769026 [Rhipicephalus microplus]|uniref:uncharacterized protein LOC142769026 n=1 Tax=Rhipicephalus microplus TaxID=6941 RepID=UPI003F6C05E9
MPRFCQMRPRLGTPPYEVLRDCTVMDSGQCLQQPCDSHASHSEDVVLSTVGDLDEDVGRLKATDTGIDDSSLPQSSNASVFNGASPSRTGFPGIQFPPWPRPCFADRPDSTCDAAYLPELDGWPDIKYQDASALHDFINGLSTLERARLQMSSQPSRRLHVGVKQDITMSETHVEHISYSDPEQYARQRDPPAVELDLEEGPDGDRHAPVVTTSGTVSTIRTLAPLITGVQALSEDIIWVKQRHLPWRPQ